MSKNYCNFDKCDSVILSWIMGEERAFKVVSEISELNYQIYHFMLTCTKEVLTERWHNDDVNDWRTDDSLNMAIEILNDFNKRTDCIFLDTSDLSVNMVAEKIIERIHVL
ncbi:MAG: hypothetical protein FWG33_03755 [Oscillospiraceae bacterium]|nr:hypothetical protein [Oscillospiraceae bacterium]